jgi:hypothetical protein
LSSSYALRYQRSSIRRRCSVSSSRRAFGSRPCSLAMPPLLSHGPADGGPRILRSSAPVYVTTADVTADGWIKVDGQAGHGPHGRRPSRRRGGQHVQLPPLRRPHSHGLGRYQRRPPRAHRPRFGDSRQSQRRARPRFGGVAHQRLQLGGRRGAHPLHRRPFPPAVVRARDLQQQRRRPSAACAAPRLPVCSTSETMDRPDEIHHQSSIMSYIASGIDSPGRDLSKV